MSVDSSNNYSQRVIAGPRVESIATKIGTKAHFHSFERLMANSLYFCVKGASVLCACACHYVQKTKQTNKKFRPLLFGLTVAQLLINYILIDL